MISIIEQIQTWAVLQANLDLHVSLHQSVHHKQIYSSSCHSRAYEGQAVQWGHQQLEHLASPDGKQQSLIFNIISLVVSRTPEWKLYLNSLQQKYFIKSLKLEIHMKSNNC